MNKRQEYRFADIDVGQFNFKTLQAISVKLTRDYLGLFGKLEKLFLKRKQGEIVLNTIYEIKQTLHLLDRIMINEKVSKEDAKILMDSINRINEDKNYFLEQVQNNETFRNELNQISETTGISPEDLNITEDIVKKGVKQARTSSKRKRPNLKGTMPYTRGLASSLVGGLGVAALGPLAPIAGMGWGMMKDVFGLGRRLGNFAIERHREKQERQLSGTLRPAAYNASSGMLGGLSARRSVPPYIQEFGMGRRTSDPLVDFFDKKAYRTKWTKEVLKTLKDSEKHSKSFGEKFKDFFTGILMMGATLLEVAATLIALGVTAGLIAVDIKLIWEYFNVMKLAAEAVEREKNKQIAITEKSTLEQLAKAGTPEEKRAILRRNTAAEYAAQESARKLTPWSQKVGGYWSAGVTDIYGGRKAKIPEQLLQGIWPGEQPELSTSVVSQPGWQLPNPIQKPLPPSSVSPEMLKTLSLIPKQLKDVAEQMGNQKDIAIRRAGEGNMHDSSDVLLNNFIQGNLTLE